MATATLQRTLLLAALLACPVALVAGSAAVPAVATDHAAHAAHSGHAKPAPALAAHPYVVAMDRDMAKMMVDMHAPGYSGDWDADFLAMMIPHHQGAIDMARLVLAHGDDPATRALAQEIIANQQTEIDAMRARLAMLRRDGNRPAKEYPSLSGTRGGTP